MTGWSVHVESAQKPTGVDSPEASSRCSCDWAQKAETHDRKLARKLSAELNGDGAAAQRSSSSLREKLASLRRGLSDATNKLQQGL